MSAVLFGVVVLAGGLLASRLPAPDPFSDPDLILAGALIVALHEEAEDLTSKGE